MSPLGRSPFPWNEFLGRIARSCNVSHSTISRLTGSTRRNHCATDAITTGAEESVMAKHMTRRQLARSIVGGALAMLMSAAVIFVAACHLAG